MDFRPLAVEERRQLIAALRGNAESEGRLGLLTGRDTSFVGTRRSDAEEVPDDEVINAIHSIPCHY